MKRWRFREHGWFRVRTLGLKMCLCRSSFGLADFQKSSLLSLLILCPTPVSPSRFSHFLTIMTPMFTKSPVSYPDPLLSTLLGTPRSWCRRTQCFPTRTRWAMWWSSPTTHCSHSRGWPRTQTVWCVLDSAILHSSTSVCFHHLPALKKSILSPFVPQSCGSTFWMGLFGHETPKKLSFRAQTQAELLFFLSP